MKMRKYKYNHKYKYKDIFSQTAFAKFYTLNSILENIFYNNEVKELILDVFSKTQKHYYAFSRLVHRYKVYKHKYVVTHDLSMNKLEPNDKLTFILVENNSNYLFNINEIINIIETSICNSCEFFSSPLIPLNPYNNQTLTISTLYNIYFQMTKIVRVVPLLFHCFFLHHFNIDEFVKEYEPIIREQTIKQMVFNSPYVELYASVIYMLKHNIYTKKLTIHEKFPKDLLVNIFRPFLFHDYIVNYYIKKTSKIYNSKYILHNKLKIFYEFNPKFGSKTIKLIKKNKKVVKHEYIINTQHISFYDIIIPPFNENETIDNY
jgi:hypothetical protein